MKEILTYRLSATGFWGYAFYRDREETGGAGCRIGTTSTVRISGEDVDWYSQFNIDTRLVPGVSRRVKDNGTGEELYRIIFWRPGMYEFSAKTGEGSWSMLAEEMGGEDSAMKLAVIYHYGIGIDRDLVEARRWYEKAAKNGDSAAAYALSLPEFRDLEADNG